MHSSVTFPQYPSKKVFIAYFPEISEAARETIKTELLSKNEAYDYCFLNTAHLVSTEQLYSALHKAVQGLEQDTLKTRSLNSEIIFNLSPVNSLNEAFKRFGIDQTRPDTVVVKIFDADEDLNAIEKKLSETLKATTSCFSDEVLAQRFDEKKFKKLFKISAGPACSSASYTQHAIAASLLRGL